MSNDHDGDLLDGSTSASTAEDLALSAQMATLTPAELVPQTPDLRGIKRPRLPQPTHSRSLDKREVLGVFPDQDVFPTFARAAATAFREGVPAHMMAATTMSTLGRPMPSLDMHKAALENAEHDVEVATSAMKVAVRRELEEKDPTLQQAYREQAQAASKRVEAAKARADELREKTRHRPIDQPSFRTNGELVLGAFHRLMTCNGRVTQGEKSALDEIFPDFSATQAADGQWWATATIRMAAGHGTVEVGPITWCIGRGGHRPSKHYRKNRGLERDAPRWLRNALLDTGQVNDEAIRVLITSQFRALPYVILAGLGGHPFPTWVGPQWREPAFVKWMVAVYTDPKFAWDKSHFRVSVERQFAVHLVNEREQISWHDWHELVPLAGPARLHNSAVPSKHTTRNSDVWHPSIALARDESGGRIRGKYEPIPCVCGATVTAATRTPDVPGDALCGTCRRPAKVEGLNVPGDLRFPQDYIDATPSMEECVAELQRVSDKRKALLPPTHAVVLTSDRLAEGSATVIDIERSLRRRSLLHPMMELEAFGFVEVTAMRRKGAPEYGLTPGGHQRKNELVRQGRDRRAPTPRERWTTRAQELGFVDLDAYIADRRTNAATPTQVQKELNCAHGSALKLLTDEP
ncbi:hypothetical protein [Nocardioides zeicaulis]|uniref:Uncharacterized protein n=1 Tax=Nocardioides zeicaulis TaxID=1776857 RepID=A0ABV6E1F4_9ACTN